MPDQNTSLFYTMSAAVNRITEYYAENWISTGDKNIDGEKVSSLPQNIDENFCKVYDLQSHNYFELCICINGSFAMLMEDHITNISTGDTCWIIPGDVHGELAKRDCSYEAIWVSIYFNSITIHLSGRKCEDGLFYTTDGYSMKSVYDWSIFTNNIKDEIAGKTSYFYDVMKSNTLQLLFLILRMTKELGINKQGNKLWKEHIALKVREYIEKNYSNAIHLNDVSQELCISSNYLNTIFKSVTGKTIIQYMDDYKIEKAKQLLKDNKYSINDISKHLNYYDQYHFSKIFKKATGYSPTQYLKR